jgi:protoporphyrinogen oxidase
MESAMASFILGGGVTGLAAGYASGLPILEMAETPGGICSSYYLRSGSQALLSRLPDDAEAYHFERGGGHWIFGGDPFVLRLIEKLTPVKRYSRRSSVYFQDKNLYVPYPLQNHLRALDPDIATQALAEIALPAAPFSTLKEWLEQSFGATLCDLFFYPFHDLYTAGLYEKIAPQDAYKSPINFKAVAKGALQTVDPVGYNSTFIYPEAGLNTLAKQLANHCKIHYGQQVSLIDTEAKQIEFVDGSAQPYETLISTLPLNQMLALTQLELEEPADPYTSVLVLNIGAARGKACPDDHWLYNLKTQSGFHRVGFYSNVDRSFLPASARSQNHKASLYIERAFLGGEKPDALAIQNYQEAVIQELQSWDFIGEIEVIDPTWIEVAYTWSWPGSTWKQKALKCLEAQQIYQVGRYGRWIFQGIADSIKEGLFAGASFKSYD